MPKPKNPGREGRILEALINAKGIRPTALAVSSGVDRVTIWQIRNGAVQKPDTETLEKLARALGEDPAIFLDEERVVPIDMASLLELYDASDSPRLLAPPPISAPERAWLLSLNRRTLADMQPRDPNAIVALINYRRLTHNPDGSVREK